MKRFDYTGLRVMFRTPGQEIDGSIQPDAVPDEFIAEIQEYCRQEKDLAERTRTLRFARSELAAMQGQIIHTGTGKKCAVAGGHNPSH
jgi:hypothetical protein